MDIPISITSTLARQQPSCIKVRIQWIRGTLAQAWKLPIFFQSFERAISCQAILQFLFLAERSASWLLNGHFALDFFIFSHKAPAVRALKRPEHRNPPTSSGSYSITVTEINHLKGDWLPTHSSPLSDLAPFSNVTTLHAVFLGLFPIYSGYFPGKGTAIQISVRAHHRTNMIHLQAQCLACMPSSDGKLSFMHTIILVDQKVTI